MNKKTLSIEIGKRKGDKFALMFSLNTCPKPTDEVGLTIMGLLDLLDLGKIKEHGLDIRIMYDGISLPTLTMVAFFSFATLDTVLQELKDDE